VTCGLFDLIERTPNLDWLLLTKRIGNVMPMVSETAQYQFDLECLERPCLHINVWLGTTIVNQEEADREIPKLLAVPAASRFLSTEPLLGPVDLERPMPGPDLDQGGGASICQPRMIQSGIDWVIVGGESGTDARPIHPDWARDLRDQRESAGAHFLFKPMGRVGAR
jgi:protein gp37